ncbi:MAG: UDP-3-O-(3-hydroxymyristoyl)glucosamine N-acyltransferase [Bacteroidia bacterium]|jgi:UDP-3-O-[3-hydroxymyristoyl] glucosamine N-acyltransferase|nr:UDP-3-O-(3-hydroxymyristoyl)glucosamine N-acyltransferase [Sphingobacteriaceae bacterium]MBP9070141.1 UDP-3-O-(3-hydroxymyristoyl)glucosamine N-acyltransferase [Bacteroidia bacterium]
MEFTANQIAGLLNGKVEGNGDVKVSSLAKIEEGKAGSLCFLSNKLYTNFAYTTDASVIIINTNFELDKPVKPTCTLIRVEDAYGSFAKLLEMYYEIKQNKKGIEQPSFISPSAKMGTDCYVGAFVYIGENVKIGNNVKIYPHVYIGDGTSIGDNCTFFSGVKIYHDCVIGNHCTIHASTVIGSDGFGFAPNSENNYKKVPQIGNVIIEDHVEIGSNTSIDRATMGSTIIRKGAKLDNLIQIAHNVEIGENTVLAGGAFVAGSAKIGKNVMMGGQAGVIGHITIADGVKIAGQSGVGSTIEKEGEIVQGSPAFAIGDYRRSYVLFRSLQKLNDRIRTLELTIAKK